MYVIFTLLETSKSVFCIVSSVLWQFGKDYFYQICQIIQKFNVIYKGAKGQIISKHFFLAEDSLSLTQDSQSETPRAGKNTKFLTLVGN